MFFLAPVLIAVSPITISFAPSFAPVLAPTVATTTVPNVPFYSQFRDITSPKWQKVGCGVTSLAMVVDFYSTSTISVNKMLTQGIAAGAYSNAGWTYAGLISLAKRYGMQGESRILYQASSAKATKTLKEDLAAGPVIVSVHYKFDPKNPIPHLVVVNRIEGETVYYNDPAASGGDKKISVSDFLKAWKKRYIIIRPGSYERSAII